MDKQQYRVLDLGTSTYDARGYVIIPCTLWYIVGVLLFYLRFRLVGGTGWGKMRTVPSRCFDSCSCALVCLQQHNAR